MVLGNTKLLNYLGKNGICDHNWLTMGKTLQICDSYDQNLPFFNASFIV